MLAAESDEVDALLLFELPSEELLFELLFELLPEELLFALEEPFSPQPVKATEQQMIDAAVNAISFLIFIYKYLLSELLSISKLL